MKKLLTLFATLCCTAISIVHAEIYSGTCGTNLTWSLNTNACTLIISGTGEMTSSPWNNYSYRQYIKSVSISDGCTSICKNAFMFCSGLISMTIPNGVTSIGEEAFSDCTGLTSVTFSNSVTNIGKRAFDQCTCLTSIDIPNSVRSIGESAFSGCSGLASITISNSVTTIGDWAFSHCTSLTALTIPNSVIDLGYRSFSGCSSLESVTIGKNVKRGFMTFENCSSLTSIIWNAKNCDDFSTDTPFYESSESYGYDLRPQITSFIFGEEVEHIPGYLCAGISNIADFTIPNSVTSIGRYAFSGCTGLTSIIIPNSVTSIGEFAFQSVPNIIYSGNATGSPWGAYSINGYIEGWFVYRDTSKVELLVCLPSAIGDITIPNSVISIGSGAFSGCEGISSVTIPNSVTNIGMAAFMGCSGLTSVTLSDSITDIGEYSFYDCSSLTSMTVPNSVTNIGVSAFANCQSMTSISLSENITKINNYTFSGCSSLSSIIIPDKVQSIETRAFKGCHQLRIVEIPNHVSKIGEEAFYDCGIDTLIIGEAVRTIGKNAFSSYSCGTEAYVEIRTTNPPTMTGSDLGSNSSFGSFKIVVVPFGCLATYQNDNRWKRNRLHILDVNRIMRDEVSTSSTIIMGDSKSRAHIVSCGIDGGEEFNGNVIEFAGLEPNSIYADVPFFVRTIEGDYDTIHYSFSTTALELTTLQSKTVSSSTAILLAETNMSDAETSCGFEYKRNDAPEDMKGTQVYCPVSNGVMAGRLKNLKDDVYYKYRAFYKSAKGNMYYGDWQYIFTGDVSVEFDPVLYTYEAVAVTETSATLKGYAIAGAEDFTEQGFEYWADSRVPQANNAPARMLAALGEHKTVQATGIKMQVTLTDLDAGTVYKYRTYAKVGNQTVYGAEMTFTTQGVYRDEEGLEQITNDQLPISHKILHNGQILILRGDKVFTVTGQEVR